MVVISSKNRKKENKKENAWRFINWMYCTKTQSRWNDDWKVQKVGTDNRNVLLLGNIALNCFSFAFKSFEQPYRKEID